MVAPEAPAPPAAQTTTDGDGRNGALVYPKGADQADGPLRPPAWRAQRE